MSTLPNLPANFFFSGGRNRRYFVRVGGVEFVVMGYQYSAITEGSVYRVYYTPITRTILSIKVDD